MTKQIQAILLTYHHIKSDFWKFDNQIIVLEVTECKVIYWLVIVCLKNMLC